jgi:hypothetical protein
MDILTVVVVFLILEGAICGLCCYACRERQVSGDSEKASKKTSHHIAPHSPRMTHGVDHQKAWSHTTDQSPNRQDNHAQMTYFTSRIASLRDCD